MKNRARFGNMGWGFLFMVFFIAACSSTPPVAYYTLNTLPEMQQEIPAAVMDNTIAIGVGPVEFPKFLDRPQIVTRKSQNQIEVSEFNRWAGSFPGDFSRVLAKNISILLPTDQVAVYPWGDQFSPTYLVKLDVVQFDGQLGETVVLDVTWMVTDKEGTNTLVVRKSRVEEAVLDKTYEALVEAKSNGLATLSREIVEELRKLAK
ncbi:MAG: membrane integrity-associated transporter subunit PqiC [Deltaproteobacteria bacterium]|nr:MAG: membrane integrity-associated transporter subunit PqiC [Deltaproteobacteria bacterium]